MPRLLTLRLGLVVGPLILIPAEGVAARARTEPQQDGPCRPPLKELTGICVTACPGGYEDLGRACVYRNESR